MMPVKCHKDGCTAGARWVVCMSVDCPEPGGVKRRVQSRSTIEVCDDHREDAESYLRDNRERLTAQFMDQGYHEPDWLTAKVTFEPVGREPVKVLQWCCRAECSRVAQWRIKRRFFEIGRKESRLEAMTNLFVCEEHKRATKPADLLDDESRKATFEWLQQQGVLLPDMDRTTIEFIKT